MLGILIVDPQYDFFPGGALAVEKGDAIIKPINRLLKRNKNVPVFVTRDWHPRVSKHFKESGGTWPVHCVQETQGAMFHKDIALPYDAVVYSKGTDPEDDAGYSGFEGKSRGGSDLLSDIKAQNVDKVVVCGLATDYCVKATVLDALKAGLEVHLLNQGIRAVELNEGDGEKALKEMSEGGALLIEDVDAFVP